MCAVGFRIAVHQPVRLSGAAHRGLRLLGLGSWLWLPVLFLLILIWAVLSLWNLLGWLFMMCIMLFAVVGGALTYLMLK